MILDPAHLATNRTTAFQVNAGGVINLVEAMIAFGVPRMVNFSSIGVLPRVVYRPVDGNHPILLADAGPGTDFYGSTKVAAEARCSRTTKRSASTSARSVLRPCTASA
jgi:nucleoside-diphosphate-sugar epimerase